LKGNTLKTADIKLGGFYVKKNGYLRLTREVINYTPSGEKLLWRDYDMEDGEPISNGICSQQSLAQWAQRKATPEEIRRLLTAKADQAGLKRINRLQRVILTDIPDDLSLAEIRRRGLTLG